MAALALAGCGGGEPDAESPLDEALGYLPADAPLAIAFSTDVEGDQYEALQEIAQKFPFGDQLISQLEQSLEEEGADYEEDLKPLLGNDVVLGVTDAGTLQEEDPEFVVAMQTEDGEKTAELIEKESKEAGELNGAKLYEGEEEGSLVAIKDDVLVAATSRESLEEAFERREGDDRLREEDFEEGLDGLPEDALVRIYGDLGAILEASPETADARKVEWVEALETFGTTLSVAGDRITFDFALNTGGDLAEEDLPIASGEEAPPVISQEGEIGLGIRNPAQIVEFAQLAAQAIDPEGFGQFETAKEQISNELQVDLDEDLINQFTGDVSVAFDVDGGFALRGEVENPQELESTLEKLVDVIPNFAQGAGLGTVAVAEPEAGEDFYAVSDAEGDGVVYGVVDNVFVLASDPERAGGLTSEQPQTVEGAEGSVVVRANAEELANQIVGQLGGGDAFGAALFTGPLGDLVGSLSADPDAVRGSFTLEIE